MKTYLVTGGAGFIGSNFILYLMEKYGDSVEVVNVDSLTYAGNLENLRSVENRSNYHFEKADVCHREELEELFSKYDVDYVVHFAAESHVDRSIRDPELFARTNVLGTMNLLDVSKKFWTAGDGFLPGKKYLQVSTDEVYGSLPEGEGFFYETTPLDPHSPYSASKASADFFVKAYMDTYGFPANITRCSNNYGPFQFPEKLIPLMIHNALNGDKLPVYGDGQNVRDWLYVEDHAKAIDLVLREAEAGQIYNVGGHNEKKNIEIVTTIIDTLLSVLPKEDNRRNNISHDLITYVEDRKGHDRRYAIAPDKIKKDLSWYPETDFAAGIRKTILWYLDHEEWMKQVTSGDYQKYYETMYHL